jgi:hypothetical protein
MFLKMKCKKIQQDYCIFCIRQTYLRSAFQTNSGICKEKMKETKKARRKFIFFYIFLYVATNEQTQLFKALHLTRGSLRELLPS